MKMYFFRTLAALLLSSLLAGCLPVVDFSNPLPEQTGKRMLRLADRPEPLLAIAFFNRDDGTLLSLPRIIEPPYDELRELTASSYAVGLVSVTWALGWQRSCCGLLLLDGSGTCYNLSVPQHQPQEIEPVCYRARLSPEWLGRLREAAQADEWKLDDWRKPAIWLLPSGRHLMGRGDFRYYWEEPAASRRILSEFLTRLENRTVPEPAAWTRLVKPRAEEDKYAVPGRPESRAEEVLLITRYWGTSEQGHPESRLEMADRQATHVAGAREELTQLLATGRYRVMVYVRDPASAAAVLGPRRDGWVLDPERDDWAPDLIRLAAERGMPLAIVAADREPPAGQTAYPGFPAGRIYWQCLFPEAGE